MTNGQGNPIDIQEWSEWKGGVNQRLDNVEKEVGELKTEVRSMPADIEKRMEKLLNGHNKNTVDFRWLFERVAIPLITAGGGAGAMIYAVMKVLENKP